MKPTKLCGLVSAGGFLRSPVWPQPGAPGPIKSPGQYWKINESMIAVQKGKDRWEIARDANTKVTGDLKVGAKVTIKYIMTAKQVEAKAEKGAKKP